MSIIENVKVNAVWPNDAGWTPQTLIRDLLEATSKAIAKTHHMEWEVELGPYWVEVLDRDYFPFPTQKPITLRQRILESPHLKDVRINPMLGLYGAVLLPHGEVK